MRRELWESLADVLTSFVPAEPAPGGLHIRSVCLQLPMEVVMPRTEVGFRLMADVPRQRWSHGFVERPTRMRISAYPVPAAPSAEAASAASDPLAPADDD